MPVLLRSRGVSSPRGGTGDKKSFPIASSPDSGGVFKGHSRGRKMGGQPGWFLFRMALLFAALCIVYFFFVAVHHNDQLEDTSHDGNDHGVDSALSEASLELIHQSAAKIHDKDFTELLQKLKNEKEEYRHMFKPKKSLYKKIDKNKPTTAAQDLIKRDKKGNIMYKPITSISIEDLGKLGIKGGADAAKGVTYDQAIKGREQLMDIIHEAGIVEIDVASILSLPKWSSVTKLYGDTPVVLGLERCSEFLDEVKFPAWDASLGTAGLFNTGTNPFAMYLEQNCKLPKNKSDKAGGTRWQVPWGKHTFASLRLQNTAGREAKTNKETVMPIVMVRDPYSWMQSMCKHPYEARWPHSKMCPNLGYVEKPGRLRFRQNAGKLPMVKSVSVNVRYKPVRHFDSLAHFWLEWYKEYLEADYPRLIVRFEDIQFHAKEVIDIICQCANGVPRKDDAIFRYVVDSAKWGAAHPDRSTNMVTAMIKYGSDKDRFKGMREADTIVASSVLTSEVMELFGYEVPEFTANPAF
ncbi:hypothetical protein IV203_031992 [Nitzschia inconspicua]|uniref:Sulfotransferase domain-containing protein n=1 Tax=Nitzschia inconspicua TaxID=303405 RepID=A0A9K3LWA0_9STRA|nr:hypothetical protein IV203_031992 [Nitzschia inconspicua]